MIMISEHYNILTTTEYDNNNECNDCSKGNNSNNSLICVS